MLLTVMNLFIFHTLLYTFFSSFNSVEVQMVFNYIKAILSTTQCKHEVKETDIGVVTPYALQAEKIRKMCSSLKGITIGPAEVLQGQEKQVVIVSTVAVNTNTLTEFVTNSRVFFKTSFVYFTTPITITIKVQIEFAENERNVNAPS